MAYETVKEQPAVQPSVAPTDASLDALRKDVSDASTVTKLNELAGKVLKKPEAPSAQTREIFKSRYEQLKNEVLNVNAPDIDKKLEELAGTLSDLHALLDIKKQTAAEPEPSKLASFATFPIRKIAEYAQYVPFIGQYLKGLQTPRGVERAGYEVLAKGSKFAGFFLGPLNFIPGAADYITKPLTGFAFQRLRKMDLEDAARATSTAKIAVQGDVSIDDLDVFNTKFAQAKAAKASLKESAFVAELLSTYVYQVQRGERAKGSVNQPIALSFTDILHPEFAQNTANILATEAETKKIQSLFPGATVEFGTTVSFDKNTNKVIIPKDQVKDIAKPGADVAKLQAAIKIFDAAKQITITSAKDARLAFDLSAKEITIPTNADLKEGYARILNEVHHPRVQKLIFAKGELPTKDPMLVFEPGSEGVLRVNDNTTAIAILEAGITSITDDIAGATEKMIFQNNAGSWKLPISPTPAKNS